MKNTVLISLTLSVFIVTEACNNSGKDSVRNADSANLAKIDSGAVELDKGESKFMVKAFNGGETEVKLGKLDQEKAKNQRVKDFASMMVDDHSSADNKLEALADRQNVKLPDSLSEDSKDDYQTLSGKKGMDFDETYMKMMLKGHKETVDMLKKELKEVNDQELKQWISKTLPTVEEHLDSAKSINKMYENMDKNRPPQPPL